MSQNMNERVGDVSFHQTVDFLFAWRQNFTFSSEFVVDLNVATTDLTIVVGRKLIRVV
jgi:hypothetical protein